MDTLYSFMQGYIGIIVLLIVACQNRLRGIFERLKLVDHKLCVEDRVDVCLVEHQKQPGAYFLRLEWEVCV